MTSDPRTLVQHSGYGYGDNPQFEHAVESRALKNPTEIRRVEKAGGVVLDGYGEAEDLAERVNYPPGNTGLIPTALGTFSNVTIDGLKIYIPVREVVG